MAGQEYRRSIYVQARRSRPLASLDTFDLPAMTPNCEERSASTVAPQALFMMNSDLVHESSIELAAEVLQREADSIEAQISFVYQACLTRPPTTKETQAATAFLTRYSRELRTENDNNQKTESLAALCRALFASNEFVYLR